VALGITFKAKLVTREAYRVLREIREFGEDPSGLLDEWGGVLEASTRNRFDTGRGPSGVPWPYSKRVLGIGNHGPANGKTLVDKGNLERSIRYEVRGRTTLIVGVDGNSESAKHAASHQFGVHKPVFVGGYFRVVNSAFGVPLENAVRQRVRSHGRKMNIPARPFLGLDNNDRRDLTEVSQSYLRELLAR
jgi:phage gpG-like protein